MDPNRKYLELKCEICKVTYYQQERVFEICKWKNRCKDHRKKNTNFEIYDKCNHCPDCGKLIWRGSKKCKSCSQKIKRNNCLDCNKKLKSINAIRCVKCQNINQDQGKSKERTKFNASRKWSKIRKSAFERDNYTCQICFKRGTYLHGHHIYSFANYKEKRLCLNNIITLCKKCHHKLHHKEEYINYKEKLYVE